MMANKKFSMLIQEEMFINPILVWISRHIRIPGNDVVDQEAYITLSHKYQPQL